MVNSQIKWWKLKSLTKEINKKEFKYRSCTVCHKQLIYHYYGLVAKGQPRDAMFICKNCNLEYFYIHIDKNNLCIKRLFIKISKDVSAFIDYDGSLQNIFNKTQGSLKNNILINFHGELAKTLNCFYFYKSNSMINNNLLNLIKEKANLYITFN